MRLIPIAQIGYDQKFYPRANGREDWLTVHRYKEALVAHPWKADARRTGAFPPVVVVKADGYEWPYVLLDGLHRDRAFAAAGLESIWAVVEKLPRSKWLERSVELNVAGKRPLDSGDKRWVATRLTEEGWHPGKIAALLDMAPASFEKLVSTGIHKLSKAAAARIPEGRSNRQVNGDRYGFLKSPFLDVTGTANAVAALESQAPVSAHDAGQIVESFISLLGSGCIDPTDEDLVERLRLARRLLDEALS